MRRLSLAIIFSLLLVSATEIASLAQSDTSVAKGLRGAQRTPTAQDKFAQSSESIKGRVIGEDGNPVADALISPYLVDRTIDQPPHVRSDAVGKFELTDLKPGTYTVSAVAEGYVLSDSGSKRLHAGESVTLTLVKSGVITGKLTNSSGNPVVGAVVRATKIREADNKRVRPHAEFTGSISPFLGPFKSDDRGTYRIYGLAPGYYQVAAGGPSKLDGFVRPVSDIAEAGLYDGDAPTYYPSSTLDTAVEVTVKAGDEVANIDIRYRDNRGHSISGVVSGPLQERIDVVLTRASNGVLETITEITTTKGFAFESLVDGEYLVTARAGIMFGGPGLMIGVPTSPSRRVTVRGADVTGVEIVLEPLASIAGRVLIEPISAAQKAECKATGSTRVEEVVISPRLDRQKPEDQSPGSFSEYRDTTANDKGEFALELLRPGVHRLDLQLPAENLFIKSITLPAPKPNGKPIDAARNGITLKSGDKVKGLVATITEGAAGLRGKVVTGEENKPPAQKMRVHLVPAEPEAVDEVLRYVEAEVASDGGFSLTNLAPGKYWLVAREMSEREQSEADPKPLAWNAASRVGLRVEGDASKKVIEFARCQRLPDFVLKYTPLTKPPTKKPTL